MRTSSLNASTCLIRQNNQFASHTRLSLVNYRSGFGFKEQNTWKRAAVSEYAYYLAVKGQKTMSCSIITTWPKVHISEYRFIDASKGFPRNAGEKYIFEDKGFL